jgi:O-acetylhomoserine (thiol)-lyase
MDGHAVQVGGAIIDGGNFDWTVKGSDGKPRYPGLCEPDETYHGTIYTRDYPASPYILKARMQIMRDFGAYPAANSAFLLNLGLETLALRMDRYCENAVKVAEYFEKCPKVERTIYPGLKSSPYYPRVQKYLGGRASGVTSFIIKGGRAAAMKFMDSLQLASREVHVADIRTCALNPASTTHRQLTDEQLQAAGVDPGLVRFSVGLEHIDDIVEDITQAFKKV